ncbi:hypothetical protein Tco_0791692 [Tanacetum coccineum]
MEKLDYENMSLVFQVESLIKEREHVKLEYQKLFNSIKMTRAQHQREVTKLIEIDNQKTYAYGDVRSQNQDLLMTIFELKTKLKSVVKRKNVDTEFDKSAVLGKLLCVTQINKNKDQKSKFVPKINVKKDLSEPVTAYSSPKLEQVKNHSFVGYPFDYRVTLGFGSIDGGLDHVNPVIRLPLKHGISRRNLEVSTNSAAPNTLNNEDTPSSSTIIIDDNEAPKIVSTSEEPTSPISNDLSDESVQEHNAKLEEDTFINPFCSPIWEEDETSLTN